MFQSIVLLLTVLLCRFETGSSSYPSTHGCKQHYTNSGYTVAHPYIDTSTFQHMEVDSQGVTRMRFGVKGKQNAYVRFTSVSTNSAISMWEISLAHFWNKRCDVRIYPRTIPKQQNAMYLATYYKSNMMSLTKPLMVTLEIHPSGLVTVTKDGESVPILQFTDSSFSYRYMGVCRWVDPVELYYDCPLLYSGDASTQSTPASISSTPSINKDSTSETKFETDH